MVNIKVTISGSFRKHLDLIIKVIAEFEKFGIDILSPKYKLPKNPGDEFILFEGEKTNDPKQLEEIHLNAIRNSDFLYVVDPGGYIGNSATMEIGYAIALNIPIYAMEEPEEFILKLFVVKKSPKSIKQFGLI